MTVPSSMQPIQADKASSEPCVKGVGRLDGVERLVAPNGLPSKGNFFDFRSLTTAKARGGPDAAPRLRELA